MTAIPVGSKEPSQIGTIVASEFSKGKTYVHLSEVNLFNAEKGIEGLNGDVRLNRESRHFDRCKNMLRICRNFALLQDEMMDHLQGLQIVGTRENGKAHNPDIEVIPYHTEEVSVPDPSRVVSYWNAQTLGGEAADTMRILPVDRILQRSMYIPELRKSYPFVGDGYVNAPVVDRVAKTVRHDPGQSWAEPAVNSFFTNLDGLAEEIILEPQDVLFIDNHRAVHSIEHRKTHDRLTYKLLHYALKSYKKDSEETVEKAS